MLKSLKLVTGVFRSLKLQIYLLALAPFFLLAVVSVLIQINVLNTVDKQVSTIIEETIIDVERRRLVTVIDSAMSIIKPYLDMPGRKGMDDALKLLGTYRFDGGVGNIFAYDGDGVRMLSGTGTGVGKNFINSQDKAGNYLVQNIIEAAKSGEGYTTYYFPKAGESEPSAKYSYAFWIDKWQIAIATGFFIDGVEAVLADVDATLEKTEKSSFTQSLIVMVVLSVLVAIVAYFAIRMMLIALTALRNAVEDLGNGEGDLTTVLPHSSLDILDDIARYFNNFLKAMIGDINNLKQASEQLNQVSVSSRKHHDALAAASEAQVKETTTVAAAIEEMSSSAVEIADNANNTRVSAEQTEAEVQDVLKQVQVSSDELGELNTVLANVETSIQELSGNVEEINSVLGVIQGISEQTNLLALNAAIEAARAGELGRGFAVVADEVRSLAQRSQESTVEIKNILEKLQASAEKTIQDMNNTSQKREAVVAAMDTITEIINSSSESIRRLTNMNVDVSNAATQQSEVVSEMARNLSGIADLADQIGKQSDETTQEFNRLEEQSEKIQQVTDKFNT